MRAPSSWLVYAATDGAPLEWWHLKLCLRTGVPGAVCSVEWEQ